MIIRLNHLDMAVLCLHMAMMRKNVRTGFKSIYGKDKGKELLSSYDEVKAALETELNLDEEQQDTKKIKQFNFNVNEVVMLSSFLDFYIPTLEKTLKEAGRINSEDQGQLDTMTVIKNQVDKLKVLHKVG